MSTVSSCPDICSSIIELLDSPPISLARASITKGLSAIQGLSMAGKTCGGGGSSSGGGGGGDNPVDLLVGGYNMGRNEDETRL